MSHANPIFDSKRIDKEDARHVQFETAVTMRVDQTDEWICVPIRSVYVDDGLTGWTFEIGPYSIAGSDATVLINTLAHYGKLSGEFREAESGGNGS